VARLEETEVDFHVVHRNVAVNSMTAERVVVCQVVCQASGTGQFILNEQRM
ncbi:hypothetical protein J6590_103196, partial [Homalodisca vitripennis]